MKDRNIRGMLSSLEQALGQGTFDVVDHWDADLTAVGVARPSQHHRLVYVRAVAEDLFDVVLEDASGSGSELAYVEVGHHRDLSVGALIQVVWLHLT